MPNIASVLKSEISRLARREIRVETQGLKKAAGSYRADIAALKRRLGSLELAVRRLSLPGRAAQQSTSAAQAPKARFSAKGLASQRKRLGLSAHDCGLLLGVSGQSIYKWEDGTARPRAKHLAALAALRSLGKKAALAHLATLREAQ